MVKPMFNKSQGWTIEEAQDFVLGIAAEAQVLGFGVGITGALAVARLSYNDLDVVFFPYKARFRSKKAHHILVSEMLESLDLEMMGAVDHSQFGDDKLVYVTRERIGRRKVDFLFPHLTFSQRNHRYPVVKRIKPYTK